MSFLTHLLADLFFGFRDGRLGRIRFFVCYVFTLLLPLLFVFYTFMSVISTRNIPSQSTISMLLAISGVFGILIVLYVSANIEAKRFRDMGLPGWSMFIMHGLIGVMIQVLDDYLCILAFVIYLLIFLCLFFLPTSFFNSET
ncbi:TPA: DUF805 domain-containing protein [Yersinia enterocolitica]|nr:DUF805 domain-containing protein [Yersinia enterocolitica]HEN3479686.1 DUF805 domain-containing protein [Yersinia enterocolitica]